MTLPRFYGMPLFDVEYLRKSETVKDRHRVTTDH